MHCRISNQKWFILFLWFFCLLVKGKKPKINPSIYLSIYLSSHNSFFSCIYLSIYLSTYLSKKRYMRKNIQFNIFGTLKNKSAKSNIYQKMFVLLIQLLINKNNLVTSKILITIQLRFTNILFFS